MDDEDLNRALRDREINPTARRVLDETSAARRRIMDRLVTSAPVRAVEGVRLKGQELPIVEYFTLLRLELVEAQQLQETGELKRSMDRYENLWRATGNLLEPPLPFIRYLVGIAVTEDLMDFYLSRRLWERDEAGTLETLAADFSQKLDRAGYRVMAFEYRLMLEGLRSIREEASGDVGRDIIRGIDVVELGNGDRLLLVGFERSGSEDRGVKGVLYRDGEPIEQRLVVDFERLRAHLPEALVTSDTEFTPGKGLELGTANGKFYLYFPIRYETGYQAIYRMEITLPDRCRPVHESIEDPPPESES